MFTQPNPYPDPNRDPNLTDPVVDQHLPSLLAQARRLSADKPETRIVGLVADEGTWEAALLLSKGVKLATAPDKSVSALIERDLAKELLRTSPRVLEWLYHDWEGSDRRLPIIHTALHRIRTGSMSYSLPV